MASFEVSTPIEYVKPLEIVREELSDLYLKENKTLAEVVILLKEKHGLDVSPKSLKKKFAQWGFVKNIKRSEALEILKLQGQRDSIGKESTFTLHQRPVDMDKVKRHGQRAGLHKANRASRLQRAMVSSESIRVRTPSPALSKPMPVIQIHKASEKLLFDVNVLLRGSFESKSWKLNSVDGMNQIIHSCGDINIQRSDLRALHNFLGHLDNGCIAADVGNFILARSYWNQALELVGILVSSRYHDILPNLIRKINDLDRNQRTKVAVMLRDTISQHSALLPLGSNSAIFVGLRQIDISLMAEVEEKVLTHFREMFALFLGPQSYNSFVMMMDAARRRLLYSAWASFDECLPQLAQLDSLFGPTDRRAMDVLGLKIEILNHRAMFQQAESEANILIGRAELLPVTAWLRFYNTTRGYYFLGIAQRGQKHWKRAADSFDKGLSCERELRSIDDYNIFTSERMEMEKYLKMFKSSDRTYFE